MLALQARRLPLLSGAAWWHANQASFPNSSSIDDLEPAFRTNVRRFVAALRQAGASVSVASTLRNRRRAYLMHYRWKVAKGTVLPANVPAMAGVDIGWDHGDVVRSQAAAATMVSLFGIRYQPSLTSLHIEGRAIDMTISWSGTLTMMGVNGRAITVDGTHNGSNPALHGVGTGYGVIKLASDPPHWSDNGH